MGDSSKIEWTDTTWNVVTGCTKVSEGCRHCYAEALAPRVFAGQTVRDPIGGDALHTEYAVRPRRFTDVRCHEDRLDKPLRWRKPRRVFVCSMADLFHKDVPDEFIDKVFAVMAMARRHTFQVLTKRPERMRDYIDGASTKRCAAVLRATYDDRWPDGLADGWHSWEREMRRVWLGVSVEDQETADERIPILLDTPAAVRFVSYEPALGPVDFAQCGLDVAGAHTNVPGRRIAGPGGLYPLAKTIDQVDWLIVGGESGPKARPCDVAWIRSAVEQCRAAGVPAFVKQLGSRPYHMRSVVDTRISPTASVVRECYLEVRDPKGGDPDEWPEDLRVREWPEARAT